MEAYDAERKGIRFEDFRKMQDMAKDGYVNPYQAESAGVPFASWKAWQEDFEKKRGRY